MVFATNCSYGFKLLVYITWLRPYLLTQYYLDAGLVSGLKRRALDEMDRRLVCFVCKEIVPSASKLEAHIQAQHTKKSEEPDTKPVVS